MTDWTRNDAIALGEIAMQVGLSPIEAPSAVMIGARIKAHGFDYSEIDAMIQWQYGQWAEDEQAVKAGYPSLDQMARYHRREKRND